MKREKILPKPQNTKSTTFGGSSNAAMRRKSAETYNNTRATKTTLKIPSTSVQNSPLVKASQSAKPSPESLASGADSSSISSQASPASSLPTPSAKPENSKSLPPSLGLPASIISPAQSMAAKNLSVSLLNPSVPSPTEATVLMLMTAKERFDANTAPLKQTKTAPLVQQNNNETVPTPQSVASWLKPSKAVTVRTEINHQSTTLANPNSLAKELKENIECLLIDYLPDTHGELVLRGIGKKIIITCPIPQKMKLKVMDGDLYLEADMEQGVWLEVSDGDLYCNNIGPSCKIVAKEIHCENVGIDSQVLSFGSILAKNIGDYAVLKATGGDILAATVSPHAKIQLDLNHTVYANSINPTSINGGRQYTSEELVETLDNIYTSTEEEDRKKRAHKK